VKPDITSCFTRINPEQRRGAAIANSKLALTAIKGSVAVKN